MNSDRRRLFGTGADNSGLLYNREDAAFGLFIPPALHCNVRVLAVCQSVGGRLTRLLHRAADRMAREWERNRSLVKARACTGYDPGFVLTSSHFLIRMVLAEKITLPFNWKITHDNAGRRRQYRR